MSPLAHDLSTVIGKIRAWAYDYLDGIEQARTAYDRASAGVSRNPFARPTRR